MSLLIQSRNFLKKKLTVRQREKLRKFLALRLRPLQHAAYSLFFGSNLQALALLYGTDKWGGHWYCRYYDDHFKLIRRRKLTILEIGVGGYADPESGGGSLRMWKAYFPKSIVNAIDIYDKSPHNEPRIRTYRGSQADTEFLSRVCAETGPIDIVIDDGSHVNAHVLASFQFLFPRLSANGIYVIEDTQTSYCQAYGGTSEHFDQMNTTKGFFRNLVDGLDFQYYERPNYSPTYYDRNIVAIHFYRNMIFINKGKNEDAASIFD